MEAYFKWRGDLPFTAAPLCEIDALVFSQLSYLHFLDAIRHTVQPLQAAAALVEGLPHESGNVQVVNERHALLAMAANSARYGALPVCYCDDRFDKALEMQFAAVTFALPDGSHMLCYRGTDATLVGWREDFNLSFADAVPSQHEALRYLQEVAQQTVGKLYLCGHSKGGNLAMYAATVCAPALRSRIESIYLFDAPGLSDQVAANVGYREALARVQCYIPQTSIIGRLMTVPERFTVVRSTATGLAQHNAFTWALDGPRFATISALDGASLFVKQTIDDFMRDSTPAARRLFVETLFGVLGAANTHTLGEMTEHWTDTAGALFTALRGVDGATRKAVLAVAGSLASSGMESARKWLAEWSNSTETPPSPPEAITDPS